MGSHEVRHSLHVEWQPTDETRAPSVADTAGAILGRGLRMQGEVCAASDDGLMGIVLCGLPPGTGRQIAVDALRRIAASDAAGTIPWDVAPDAGIALFDAARRRVIVRGDRFGRVRVYYRRAADLFVAGTDLASVAPGGNGRALSSQAIFDYVYFHAVPSPRSIRADVTTLAIGAALLVDGRTQSVVNAPAPNWKSTHSGPDAARDELLQSLRAAVARSLPAEQADVACFLSGGLDSSTVAGLAAERLGGHNVHAFSIGFAEPRYDESEYAAEAARHFGLQWHRHELGPDEVAESLDDIISAMPEPFGNSSAVAVYHCARQARLAGFTYMLAGDGGDEVFGGNSRYAKQLLFERYLAVPPPVRRWLIEPAIRASLWTGAGPARKAQSYVAQATVPLPDRLQSYNYLHRHPATEVFSDAFLRTVDIDEPLHLLRQEYRSCTSADPVNRMLQLDWRFTLHDNDLVKVNSMCHAAGVSTGYPMLDRELVALGCSFPGAWKVHRGDLRWLYRRAMRGTLPDKIIDKPKHGFGLPFGVWTQTHGPLRAMAESALDDLATRGMFRPEFLAEALDRHRSVHAGYYGELVWVLAVLEMWLARNAPDAGL